MENSKNSTALKVGLVIALALFLVTGFYAMNLYSKSKEDIQELNEQKQLVMTDLNAMAKQYDEAISENTVTNNNLIEARERIQGLIDSLKISETNIKSLWRYRKKYKSLQKEMTALLAQNDSLRVYNSYLETSLDSTMVQLEERTVFTDSLLLQNNALAEVVLRASALSVLGLKGFGVIQRTSGKLIPTERSNRADKIRVCFTIAKNNLVKAGDQELYIQVIGPKSNILGLNEQLQIGEDKKAVNYSVISKFNYENANLDICEFVELKGKEEFESGRYMVNVFNSNDLISTSQFTLK